MARTPEYRLQVLLELRARKKDDAEGGLAGAIAVHRREVERRRTLEGELARLRAEREQKRRDYAEKAMLGELAPRELAAANVFLDHLERQERARKSAVEAQSDAVAQSARGVDAARQELLKAAQELEALEKHEEKVVRAWEKQQAAKEEAAMDELAQRIVSEREPW